MPHKHHGESNLFATKLFYGLFFAIQAPYITTGARLSQSIKAAFRGEMKWTALKSKVSTKNTSYIPGSSMTI
jgi:hypothetical protein